VHLEAPTAAEPAAEWRGRRPERSLFRRLVVINGLVFAVGTLVLALSPATVSSPVLIAEIPVLVIGLAVILAANALLVRTGLSPLSRLAAVMQRVELLRGGDRVPGEGGGDLAHLISSFNTMLDRLEAEHNAASAHALAAQEGERERIARELHDEVGQSLTAVLLGLKRVVDRAPADLVEDLRGTQDAVRSTLEEVRQVARRLRPGVLSDLGLLSALESLCRDFSAMSGIPVTSRVSPTLPNLGAEVELVVYRVAQEALTNIARHAGATRVELSLRLEVDGLVLRIIDNGQGGVLREGAGIRGMRERALLIEADLTLDSRRDDGTDVILVVPEPAAGS